MASPIEKSVRLAELHPRGYPQGCVRLSEEVDAAVYGA